MGDFLKTRVRVKEGDLEGYTEDGLFIFKGIPYAEAPVRDRRFQPSVSKKPWIGIRPAKEFGAKSVQPMVRDKEFRLPDQSFCDEDCLFLNIYSQAKIVNNKLSVFVWIHGGSFNSGAGSHFLYHAEDFAKECGIVVVTINYRLGLLGFFAHPELSEKSKYGSSGNYALFDQLAAIRWVRENIEAFGGDAERITIGGQSAGAMSVDALLASPLAKGVFRRATVQSGPMFYSLSDVLTLSEMEIRGVRFLAENNLTLEQLTQLSATEVMERSFRNGEKFSPCIDGWFLKESPWDAAVNGRCCAADLLIGSTSDEFGAHPEGIPVEKYRRYIEQHYGAFSKKVFEFYPAENERKAAKNYIRLSADVIHRGSVKQAALAKNKGDVYAYYFSHPVKCENADIYGAPHNAELPYLFHRVGRGGPLPWLRMEWNDYDHVMSKMVMEYWGNFIKTGNPNGDGLPEWKCFQMDEVLEFGDTVRMMERSEMQKKFALIDEMEAAGISFSSHPAEWL